MKPIKYIYAAAALCLAASMTSCDDWLDTVPSDSLSEADAIQSSSDLGTARVGMYAALKGSPALVDYYGQLMFVYGDMRGEDVQYEYNAGSNRGSFYYYMEYTTADNFYCRDGGSTAVWQTPYVVIARACRIIEAAEGGLNDAQENADVIAQYVAEAKVMRALALFDLTRIYGTPYVVDNGASLGVPIVTQSLQVSALPSRNTVAECYQQVEKDLTEALNSGALPTDMSQGYINEWVAKALQVRVYLTKGQWSDALRVAQDIIGNSPYSLWTTDEYVNAWNENNAAHNNEMILEMIINDSNDWTDRNGIAYLYCDGNGLYAHGYGDVIVTKAFSDMLMSDPADVRNNVLLEAGLNTAEAPLFDGRKVYINKMPAIGGDVRYSNVPLLRLSEVYLSAAEAAYNSGDLPTAAAMLNDIITNRTTDATKTVTAATVTLERIYVERRKELVGEGQRYFDAMRRGETITRYTSEADQGWHAPLNEDARSFNRDSRKALPLIPTDEINANPNMEQNPLY